MIGTWVQWFWAKVNKHGPLSKHCAGRCWEWTAGCNKAGYGQFHIKSVQHEAHRVAFYLAYGNWPVPMALHKCDNTLCVRPNHLFEGTCKDNAQDMLRKGRANKAQGTNHGSAKLSKRSALYIRNSHKTARELAHKFGVSQSQVSRIKVGERWASVGG
jgi:hypothetical protein